MAPSSPTPRLPRRVRLRRALSRLRAHLPSLPTLAPLEKTALVALALVLSTGALLRLWERSGITLGPVRDWDTLRGLVLQSRLGLPDGETFPCLDAAPPERFAERKARGDDPGEETTPATEDETVTATERPREVVLLAAGAPARTAPKSTGGAKPSVPPRPLDLNRASTAALESLPGVGPATARAIVEARAASGGFRSVDDLLRVKGIGPKRLETLRPYLHVPMHADTLPRDENPREARAERPALR